MKIKSLIIAAGLALVAVAGVNAGLSVKQDVKAAKATETTYYFSKPTSWGGLKLHYWGGTDDTTWPGVDCTFTGWKNESSQEIWSFTFDASAYTGFKMNDGTNQSQNLATSDLLSDAQNAFWIKDDGTFGGKWGYELPSKDIYFYNKDKYIYSDTIFIDAFGGTRTTYFPGIQMTKVPGTERIFTAKIYSSNTTVIFSNGNSGNQNQTGDITIVAKETAILNTDWGTSWTSLEAATFVDNYLHFDDVSLSDESEGTACLTYFGEAEKAYAKLSSDAVRTEAAGIENVEARLSAWARANHSSFSSASGFGTKVQLGKVSTNSTATIIVVTSAIALIALGGFFFLRKRKEI